MFSEDWRALGLPRKDAPRRAPPKRRDMLSDSAGRPFVRSVTLVRGLEPESRPRPTLSTTSRRRVLCAHAALHPCERGEHLLSSTTPTHTRLHDVLDLVGCLGIPPGHTQPDADSETDHTREDQGDSGHEDLADWRLTRPSALTRTISPRILPSRAAWGSRGQQKERPPGRERPLDDPEAAGLALSQRLDDQKTEANGQNDRHGVRANRNHSHNTPEDGVGEQVAAGNEIAHARSWFKWMVR